MPCTHFLTLKVLPAPRRSPAPSTPAPASRRCSKDSHLQCCTALPVTITAVVARPSRDAARLGGYFASLLRGLSTAPPGSGLPRAALPWVARRPASAVPSLPGSENREVYYDPSEAPHHYVWSTKMSRARVYADVNTKRPRSYWDYENMTITWGCVHAQHTSHCRPTYCMNVSFMVQAVCLPSGCALAGGLRFVAFHTSAAAASQRPRGLRSHPKDWSWEVQ